MKKIIRMLLVAVISLTIVATFPVSVFAYEYGEPNLDEMIQVKKVGEKEITSISASDVNRIRISKAKTYRDKSDKERLMEVLGALGVDLNEFQKEKAMSMVSLSDVGRVQVTYLQINTDGTQIEIGKEDALIKTVENNSVQLLSTTTEPVKTDTTKTYTSVLEEDGTMEQQLIVIYTPHYDGVGTTPDRYVFIGVCKWIIPPVTRKTDCIAFLSTDFRWNNKGIDDNVIDDTDEDEISNYNLLVTYTLTENRDGQFYLRDDFSESFDENDAEISSLNGAFFEYNLKNDIITITSSTTYTNFGFMMSAIGKTTLMPTSVQNVGVDFMYVHAVTSLVLSPNYSWSGESEGSSIGVSFTTTTRKYIHGYTWKYYEDYNDFFS